MSLDNGTFGEEIVITAGFRETQLEKGEKLHRRLAESAARERIRVIGPNTFGLANLDADLPHSLQMYFFLISISSRSPYGHHGHFSLQQSC